jgi:hypothetical protein
MQKKKTKSHMLIEIKKLKDMRKNKSHLPKKKKGTDGTMPPHMISLNRYEHY